jgi:hypothetical protein
MERRMEVNLTVSIDDVHPEQGWGLPGDTCMNYLYELYREFGTKFTLFVPSNYHGKFPLSEHKDWVQWLLDMPYVELAAHGHYHETSNRAIWGECEFAEIKSIDECSARMAMLWKEWDAVGHKPKGWRNPGWLAQRNCIEVIGPMFDYAAVHYEHNHNLPWACKTLYGHDDIQAEGISLHNGNNIMFQSHIAGDWNRNVWNQDNFEQFRNSLAFLHKLYKVNNKFMYEI